MKEKRSISWKDEFGKACIIGLSGGAAAVLTALILHFLGVDHISAQICSGMVAAMVVAEVNAGNEIKEVTQKMTDKIDERAEQSYLDACKEIGKLREELERKNVL